MTYRVVDSWLDAMASQLRVGAPPTLSMVAGAAPVVPSVVLAVAEAAAVFRGGGWVDDLGTLAANVRRSLKGSEALSSSLARLDLSADAIDLDRAEDADDCEERLESLVAFGSILAAFPDDARALRRVLGRNTAVSWLVPEAVTGLADAAGFYADVLDLTDGPLSALLTAIDEASDAVGTALTPAQVSRGRAAARRFTHPPPFLAWARRNAPGSGLVDDAERALRRKTSLAAESHGAAPQVVLHSLAVRRETDEQVALLILPGAERVWVAWSGANEPPTGVTLLPEDAALDPDDSPLADVFVWVLDALPEGPFTLRLTRTDGQRWEIDVPIA